MVRPATFRMNEQTAINNFYQKPTHALNNAMPLNYALQEFDALVSELQRSGVEVIVAQDTTLPETPDALFPNNWVSFHENQTRVLYSMYAENRRTEKLLDILSPLNEAGISFKHEVSFSEYEKGNKFLEGTGSLVLDRKNSIAYASISERTNEELVNLFCQKLNFEPVLFHSFQTVENARKPIYHTNVMMCIGERFAVLCADSIDSTNEKERVIERLGKTGHEIIFISEKQVNQFAGNMLELENKNGDKIIAMSTQAFGCLEDIQRLKLSAFGKIIHSNISTIETLGGGSARCMIAELF